jgi:small GTP-binding protein
MDLGHYRINGFQVFLFGTPGLLRFSMMRDIVTAGADGLIFMFDSAHPEKDEEAISILNAIRKILPSNTPIIFLANKQDLEGARYPEIIKIQNDLSEDKKVFPTSTKTGLNVDKSLKFIVNEVYEGYKNLLTVLKNYQDDITGLAEKLNKDTAEMKQFLNTLEVKKFIELNRKKMSYKIKNGLKYLV